MASKNYKINIAGKTYEVEVGDISKSPVKVSVDGTVYQVEIPGHYQQQVDQLDEMLGWYKKLEQEFQSQQNSQAGETPSPGKRVEE